MTALPPYLQELREAQRALIRCYGGQEAVALRFDLGPRGQQKVSELLNSDRLLPLPWIAEMEAATRDLPGHPHVTTALARNVDRFTVIRPQEDAGTANLPSAVMAISCELGDLSRSVMQGLSDGDFCPADAEDALRELEHLEQHCASLRAQLQTLKREKR